MQFLDVLRKQARYFLSVAGAVTGNKVLYLSKSVYYN
jgi:hypothetical protein